MPIPLIGIISLIVGLVYLVLVVVYFEQIEVWGGIIFLGVSGMLISMGIFLIAKRFFRTLF